MSVYARAGVNVEDGDSFSAFAAKICRESYGNSPFIEVRDYSDGHFRGLRTWKPQNLPDLNEVEFNCAPDGMGTKPVLISAANNYQYAPENVVAMTGTDITRSGGEPAVFCNVLSVEHLGALDSTTRRAYQRLMYGLGEVAKKQRFVCFAGETAEDNVCVGSENPDSDTKFNWVGFMIGLYLPDRMITGATLAPGQVVVALCEPGPRSNGITAILEALRNQFGAEWWKDHGAKKIIERAAMPATLYDRFLADMNGWTYPLTQPRFKFHLIAHITGGGIVRKFGHDCLFKSGLSATLGQLFQPPVIHKQTVEWTGMSEEEAYEVLPSGNGALVVLDPHEADEFVGRASLYQLNARICGVIEDLTEPSLRIKSGYSGDWLTYSPRKPTA